MNTHQRSTDIRESDVPNIVFTGMERPDGCRPGPDIPATMRAVVIRRADDAVLAGMEDEHARLHAAYRLVDNVPVPRPGDDEILLRVMAAGLNYNTLWALERRPVSTFDRLGRFAKIAPDARRHNLDYQILGSDASGVVIEKGRAAGDWEIGDHVVVHPVVHDAHSPRAMEDVLLDGRSRIWGYETNFGSFAEYCVVKATQLLPKPRHLSWAEAAVATGSNSTVYRMLVSPNGAQLKLGESVLVWGACGGIGSFAVQYALKAGAAPVAIVSSENKAGLVRKLGCRRIIVRDNSQNDFVDANGEANMRRLVRLRKQVLDANDGRPPDVVFEHPGRATFFGSVFVAAPRGRIVTCGSTTGHVHSYDNRYLWMYGKSIIGTHCASWSEAARANDLLRNGTIVPLVGESYPLDAFPDAVERLRHSRIGKTALLCGAKDELDGVEDCARRAKVGEGLLGLFAKRNTR